MSTVTGMTEVNTSKVNTTEVIGIGCKCKGWGFLAAIRRAGMKELRLAAQAGEIQQMVDSELERLERREQAETIENARRKELSAS